MSLQCFYTTYGEVYIGYEFFEIDFPNHTIIIQGDRSEDYKKLQRTEKTLEKIREFGWAVKSDSICGIIDYSQVPKRTLPKSDSVTGGYDRKVMFLFGAGASAFCIYGDKKDDFKSNTSRPPLGVEMFDDRFSHIYKNYKGVTSSLYMLQGKDIKVEEILEEDWKEIYHENNPIILSRHMNIQYYVQDILRHVTSIVRNDYTNNNLYARMLDRLQRIHNRSRTTHNNQTLFKKFAFVSFNQDTILESFLEEYIKLETLDDYVNMNDSPFCVFKPHGSWNWGWEFPDSSFYVDGGSANKLFNQRKNFFQLYFELLGNHIDMVDWRSWGTLTEISKNGLASLSIDKSQIKLITPFHKNLNIYFPALLLPYRDKDEFTMPPKHYDNMKWYLHEVECLIIIGWKGNEEAFNRMLFKNGNRINKVIIADPHPEEVEKNLAPLLTKRGIEKKNYLSFEDFVLNGLDKELS